MIITRQIPLVDLKKQYAPFKEEILERVENILDGMHLYLGENVQELERSFSSFAGTEHGIAVSDGTAALQIILRAMNIGPGDEVITVSHTFIATVEAVLLVGARPVFVDIDPQTSLIDVSQVEDKITEHTRAIIPVHLYGQTADMDALNKIARKHHLYVIEDACQAHGATYQGRPAGSLGDAAAFSFYYSKNLGAYGEGGFISTNNAELAERVRMIRDHGSKERYHHELLGFNGRIDEIQAAVLLVKLPYLQEWNEKRRAYADLYNHLLQDTPVQTPVTAPGNEHVYHLYVIQAPARDALQAYLKECGVASGIHYPIPVHLQPVMRSFGYQRDYLPNTEQVAGRVLSLPMYAELSEEEIGQVSAAVHEFYRERASEMRNNGRSLNT